MSHVRSAANHMQWTHDLLHLLHAQSSVYCRTVTTANRPISLTFEPGARSAIAVLLGDGSAAINVVRRFRS